MKNLYTYLTLASVVALLPCVCAGVVPTWGKGEVTVQMVDNTQSNAVSDLFQTEQRLVESALKGLKGIHSSKLVEKALAGDNKKEKGDKKGALTEPSEAVTGKYEGLENVLGKNSSYGQIKVKSCGGNIGSVVNRVNEAFALPATQSGREGLTTGEMSKRDSNRNTSIEGAATTALSKAWIVETEAANIAESISDTQEELNKATSQMMVLVTILRLQEETQKSINTRLSLMGDELISSGLAALDSGL